MEDFRGGDIILLGSTLRSGAMGHVVLLFISIWVYTQTPCWVYCFISAPAGHRAPSCIHTLTNIHQHGVLKYPSIQRVLHLHGWLISYLD